MVERFAIWWRSQPRSQQIGGVVLALLVVFVIAAELWHQAASYSPAFLQNDFPIIEARIRSIIWFGRDLSGLPFWLLVLPQMVVFGVVFAVAFSIIPPSVGWIVEKIVGLFFWPRR